MGENLGIMQKSQRNIFNSSKNVSDLSSWSNFFFTMWENLKNAFIEGSNGQTEEKAKIFSTINRITGSLLGIWPNSVSEISADLFFLKTLKIMPRNFLSTLFL